MKIDKDEFMKEVGKYLTNISLIIFTVVIAGGVFDRISGGVGIAIAFGVMLFLFGLGTFFICIKKEKKYE